MADVPTVSLDESTPAGSDKIREADDRIREFKKQVREIVGVDHDYPSSGKASDNGQHLQITLQEQANLGTGAVNATILGSQTVNGEGELVYTDENDRDVVLTRLGGIALPSGSVLPFAGAIANVPTGFIFCNGAAINRTTYAALFAAIGTIHGIGDGSTTFNLPDLRDVSIMGSKQDSSGTPKTNVSGALTQDGGAATHTLTSAQMPAHTHTYTTAVGSGISNIQGSSQGSSTVTGSTGSGSAHNNLHPYYVMTYMIKT